MAVSLATSPALSGSQSVLCFSIDQTANRVLDLVDTPNEFLAVLDERAVFSHSVTRYMDRGELPHHRHSGQLERVVLVRLAFDVLPPPGFVVRAADQRLEPQFPAQVVDPSARPAGFHHNQINLVVLEDCRVVATAWNRCLCVSVSKEQHIELHFPRSIARMYIIRLRGSGVVSVTRCNVSLERSQLKGPTPPQTTDLHGFLLSDSPKHDPNLGRATSPGKRPSRASRDGCFAGPSQVGVNSSEIPKDCQDWCMARAFSPRTGCCGAEFTSLRPVGRGM